MLAVIEAMKMETSVVARMAGTVEQVLIKEGGSVKAGELLITIVQRRGRSDDRPLSTACNRFFKEAQTMETILHLLPLTGRRRPFRPPRRSLSISFSPPMTAGSQQHPQEWRERTTILLGYVPPEQLKTFPNLKWVQSWNAGVDPYLVPGVLPEGVRLTSAVEPTAQPCLNTCWPCSWPSISACPPTVTSRGPISGRILDPLAP